LRYKTFQATGIAPDGRLYAGDLNAIQDLYLPLSDFTSTVDVGTLRVGDASLQLYKYGAGEFRMTGHMRFDGIMRGLGGMVAGAFTTTQRNAISAGSRPYGLVILNTTTNLYEWNSGTDASPVWVPLGGGLPAAHASTHLPGGSDPINFATAVHMAGTRAAKPAASASNLGLLYFETDWNQTWRSNGSAWVRIAMFGKPVVAGDIAGLSAIDGDEILLAVTTGVNWAMRYNAAGGTYKWEAVGGPGLYDKNDSIFTATSASYSASTPSVAIPRPGVYDVEIHATGGYINAFGTADNQGFVTVTGPGITASDSNAARATKDSDGLFWSMSKIARLTFTSAGTVQLAYRASNSDNFEFERRVIRVQPVQVS
jgi:hypothetical protein